MLSRFNLMSEMVENRGIYISHLYLAPARGDPVGISWRCLMLIRLEWLGYRKVKKLWQYIICIVIVNNINLFAWKKSNLSENINHITPSDHGAHASEIGKFHQFAF